MADFSSAMRWLGRGLVAVVVAFVKPWPIHPLMVVPMVLFFTMWTVGLAVVVELSSDRSLAVWRIVVSIIVPMGILIGAYVLVWRWKGSRQSLPWWGYYALLIGLALVAATIRVSLLTPSIPPDSVVTTLNLFESTSLAPATLRVLISLLLFNSIFGAFASRLHRQIDQTENALEVAKEQQRRLVRADEAARVQVAKDLHDRIQSSLVLIGMQVQRIAKDADPQMGDQLRSISDEIEYVRGERLHEVIEGLAPDYDLVGLRSALEALSRRYSPALAVELAIDADAQARIEGDVTWVEAVYRICEQALLNSLVHGRAAQCTVAISESSRGVVLRITDDGSGLGEGSVGLGTAVTDAWVQQTSGSWGRDSGADGGVVVEVSWPSRR